jgi:uncharacterized metal-binding protein YceD (DUF177 family)
MDIQRYFADVRAVQAKLAQQFPQGFLHLTSVYNRDKGTADGNVTIAAVDNASRCLAEATHRISTEAEITAYENLQAENRRRSQEAEFNARKQYFVPGYGMSVQPETAPDSAGKRGQR